MGHFRRDVMQPLLFIVGCILLACGGVFGGVALWRGVDVAAGVGLVTAAVGGVTALYFR